MTSNRYTMLAYLNRAHVDASAGAKHAALFWLHMALGLANDLHDKRRVGLILAAISYVRRMPLTAEA